MKLIKEYNFVKDTKINRNEWNVQVGKKWANHEAQQYVDSVNNLYYIMIMYRTIIIIYIIYYYYYFIYYYIILLLLHCTRVPYSLEI